MTDLTHPGPGKSMEAEKMESKLAPYDCKFVVSGDTGSFTGYGAVFGNIDACGDVIAKGAFKTAISRAQKTGNWPAMLLQHGGGAFGGDDMMPVGIWTDLEEDDTGLRVAGKLALDTRRGQEAYALMKMQPRPALNGLSIGYRATKFSITDKPGPQEPLRTIQEVDLYEVSLVTWPANDRARVDSVKHFQFPRIETIRECEAALRERLGLSHSEARAFAERGFKGLRTPRDEDGIGEAIAGSFAELAEIIRK